MQPNNEQNPYYPPRDQAQPMQPVSGQPQASHMMSSGGVSSGGSYNHSSGPAWGWIAVTIVLSIVTIITFAFALWAYSGRQDFKNNVDQKVSVAVGDAKKQQVEEDNKRFAEELKNPLQTYTGPSDYGSVSVQYPKAWSAYLASNGLSSDAILDVYFHPEVIPPLSMQNGSRSAVALNVQVLNQSYSQAISGLKTRAEQPQAQVVAEPYALPKMPSQAGILFRGQLTNDLNGLAIYVPLRDKTIKISTDTDQYLADFNNYILPNISFEP